MLSLSAKIRTELGKKNRKLRREGVIPAVLYGRKVKSTPIVVGYKEFEKVYGEAGESSLISLNLENAKDIPAENTVLIRDTRRHPLTRLFTHLDFYQVPMDEKITVRIPIVFEGEALAVRDESAVLVRNIYEIEVKAFPKDLPREIKVDLSELEHIGDSIFAKNLAIPTGVEIGLEDDFVIAAVSAPVVEEIAETASVAAEATPAATEIKTEAEVKRAEREAKKAEEAAEK